MGRAAQVSFSRFFSQCFISTNKPAAFVNRHDTLLSHSCPAGVYHHHRQVCSEPKPGHQLETKGDHRFHQDVADPDARWPRPFLTPEPSRTVLRRRSIVTGVVDITFTGELSQVHTRIRLRIVPGDPHIPCRTSLIKNTRSDLLIAECSEVCSDPVHEEGSPQERSASGTTSSMRSPSSVILCTSLLRKMPRRASGSLLVLHRSA